MGKDVAEALGYSNPRDALSKHIDGEDKNTVAFHDGTSGNPNQTSINESGLYTLVLSSKIQIDYNNRKYQAISSIFKHKFMRFNRNVIQVSYRL